MDEQTSKIKAKLNLGEADFDFYKCQKCGRLITRIEELAAFTPGTKSYGQICPCGNKKYHPVNMRWFHWFLPRVLRFAYFRARGMA